MKSNILSTILFSILVSISTIAQTITWSSEITVANGSTYGVVRPRIAVTAGNIPVVMWGGGTGTQPLLVARWNGSGFNTPMVVTGAYDPFIDTWAGADIAARGNTVYVVFKVQPEMSNNIYCVKSSDGGVTWGMPVQVDIGTGPYDRFPSIAVTSSGNPAVMFMTFDSTFTNAGYAITNSTNGGASFPLPVNASLLGGSNVCDCCPGYMEINGSNQVAAWRRNNSDIRDMWAGVSTNGGMNFTTGIDVDNTNWLLNSCPSSGPDPFLFNDSLTTVFMSGAGGSNRIYLNTSNIITQQAGFTQLVNGSVPATAIQNYPFISGSSDTMAVVYQQAVGGNIDVYYSLSLNGASGLLNNSAVLTNSTAGNQKNPHIAYSANKFHFVWVDDVTGNVMYKYGTITPSGISENEITPLQVYPNPSNGMVNINLSQLIGNNATLNVYDVSGRIVESKNVSGMKNIILEKQTPGIYFIRIQENGEKLYTTKVVFY